MFTRLLTFILLCAGASEAMAAGALNFNYSVDGPANVRPSLVFNDGVDTFIQPRSGVVTTVPGAHEQGPYLVIPGMPSTIEGKAARKKFLVNMDARGNRAVASIIGYSVGEASAKPASTRVIAKAGQTYVFMIDKGQLVSAALGAFLRSNGADLDWSGDDMRAKEGLSFEGTTPKAAVSKAVAAMGLPAVWLTDANRVLVSDALRNIEGVK